MTVTKYLWFSADTTLPYIVLLIYQYNRSIIMMVREFSNSSGDRGSILGCVIWKTQKMVLDISLLNTLRFKVQINGKWIKTQRKVKHSP